MIIRVCCSSVCTSFRGSAYYLSFGERAGIGEIKGGGSRKVWGASLLGRSFEFQDSYRLRLNIVFCKTWAFEGWNQRWRTFLHRHLVIWMSLYELKEHWLECLKRLSFIDFIFSFLSCTSLFLFSFFLKPCSLTTLYLFVCVVNICLKWLSLSL